MNVLITGISSGIGLGLTQAHLAQGDQVFGLSRRAPTETLPDGDWSFASVDLGDFEAAPFGIRELLADVDRLDVVWLNAGVLGAISDMAESSIEEMQKTFDLNVWANKVVLDTIFDAGIPIPCVIAMSSGAAVKGNRGWSGYAISKAALNMLVQLYAAEQPQTHFLALAPGLVDTAMQDVLCGLSSDPKRPSVDVLKQARGTDAMPHPKIAGQRLIASLPKLRKLASGSFADIRKI